MSDLIDRQKAIDDIDHVIAIGDEQLIGFRDDTAAMLTWQLKKDAMNVIKHRIKELPSAEPQKVTCHDCRWNDGTAYCEFHYRDVKGSDFCSWGERSKQ